MSVLVTGAAGFIGFHVASKLLDRGERVIGIDNLNEYYDIALKSARLAALEQHPGFAFARLDIADRAAMGDFFAHHGDVRRIVHLAAQAGVRHSLIDPYGYIDANVMGQLVVLEEARRLKRLESLVYASSSSVYGANTKQPFSTEDRADHPVSLYAASKRAGELITESHCRLYGLTATGLRFFTVYGPWGRPDMAYYLFTAAILAGRPIKLFNKGEMARDFTYIDDAIAGALAALDRPPASSGEHRLYNIGNNRPERLADFLAVIERAAGRAAITELAPMQPGDVVATCADIEPARRELGYQPTIPITEGLPHFVAWYKDFHGIG